MPEDRAASHTVFLACPYGQIGGGMGSIMTYLAAWGVDSSGRFRLEPLETRGSGHVILSLLYLFHTIGSIVAEAARGRLAIVHINLADGASVYRKAVVLLATKLVGCKVLLHLHAGRLIPMYEDMTVLGKIMLRTMAHRADHCIVVGEKWKRWLVETLGVTPHAVSVIHNGVPETTGPRKPQPNGTPFRLLFIGNLLPQKGVADLLQALALPEMRNTLLTLTLAGGGPVDKYKELAAQLGIVARIHFTGWVSQARVRELMTEADALVLPSYAEALPLVVLEALASRLPVICTPVGALPDLLQDRKHAVFVPLGDHTGLAAAMLMLSRDFELQKRLSEAGFALYQKKFSMSAFREHIGSLYHLLAGENTDRKVVRQHSSGRPLVAPQAGALLSPRLARLRARCSREEWNLGLVPQTAEDIVRHGITEPIQWLPRRGTWDMLADPACLVLPDNTRVVFAEHLNQWVGRGEIWTACIPPSGDIAQAAFRPWMRSNGHLSYPFPFHDEMGHLCFMVESGEARALHLWRDINGALQNVGPIINRPVIDATPWYDGIRWWLFCTLRNDEPNERLHLFHAPRLEGPWTPHVANPVKWDLESSRPAGPLFRVDGRLIRAAQDCSETYGGAVVLHAVVRLDLDAFHEVPVRRLEPDVVYAHGLHTLCPAGEVTIIDGKRWVFEAIDVSRKVVAGMQNRIRPLRKAGLPSSVALPFTVR